MEGIKVVIKGINQELVRKRTQYLIRKGIIVNHRGNKIDLEIMDQELAKRILKKEYGFVLWSRKVLKEVIFE